MPSPFPGMDPFIEQSGVWGDFHTSMYTAIRAELNAILPARFVAAIDLYIWIHEPDAKERTLLGKPDVFVKDQENVADPAVATATRTRQAPHSVLLPPLRKTGNKFVKIVDQASGRVVTVIEILSPANKTRGPDRDGYLAKRNEYLASGVHFVEIDLLRRGERMPFGESPPAATDYYVMVSRAADLPRADFWPLTLRDPLPEIGIPLIDAVSDVPLNLKRCLDRAYDEGRYQEVLRYDEPIAPPLPVSDQPWLNDILPKL